ncbi:MAG TPA: lysylphosphatidylglycerol synthase transmembrane domain-containing protein [Longimicrobiales bacterium]|nr:lysylphosphatidylglycerol synthase transmembrane domain-containing protein [Longimicrobiales bacterium]
MSVGGARRTGRPFLDWKGLLGIGISLALLYYAFRGVDFGEVISRVREADLWLLVAAGLMATTVFPLRAFRWGPLLRPLHATTTFHSRFAATCIGFMANNLLPARMGEFARAYALSRLEPVRASASFGSLVVERVFDGVTVVALLLVALSWPSFPEFSGRDFGGAATGLALAVAVAFGLLLLMVHAPARSLVLFQGTIGRILPKTVRRPIADALVAFLEGVAAIRDWRIVLLTLGWSLVVWGAGAVAFWIGFRAFGLDVPFLGAVFLQSVIALAVSLPSAPGFFGLFEAGARIGLVEVWGVESSPAVAFALGFHIAGFIPITALGLYYVWRLGLSWRDVEESEEAVETAVEAGESAAGGAPTPAVRGKVSGEES